MSEGTAEKTKTEKKSATILDEGQVSIVVEGQEVVFKAGQMELAGMPDATRLRKLAASYVAQALKVAEEKDRLHKLNQEIMLELRNEGRTGFAYRESGRFWQFLIDAPEESLVVKVKGR